MRIRSFIIAYALVLAILLFADRRPGATQQDRYSHVVDLTDGQNATVRRAASLEASESRTRIIAPAAIIPGTWAAGQIPPERLIAPLIVMDLKSASDASSQISLDDIAAWEARHGMIPQGAIVAIRRSGTSNVRTTSNTSATLTAPLPIARDAALFLVEARDTIGFAVETSVNLSSDRTLATQLALHGNYIVEGTAEFSSLPVTGSLVIVAPAKNKKPGEAPVRILAMVR
ncbi:MAG TPA: cyclase family protein [Terriglobales bacterium]